LTPPRRGWWAQNLGPRAPSRLTPVSAYHSRRAGLRDLVVIAGAAAVLQWARGRRSRPGDPDRYPGARGLQKILHREAVHRGGF